MSRRRTALTLAVTALLTAGAASAADAATRAPKLLPLEQTNTMKRIVPKERGSFPKAPKVRLTPEMKRDKVPLIQPRGRTGAIGGPEGRKITRPAAAPEARFNGTTGTYANKIDWSVYYIDRYWASAMGSTYRSPTIYAAMERYTGGIWCGGERLTLNNAWYCPNFVAWDTNFLYPFFAWSRGGDMAVAAILAHEWGHLTAYQLRLQSSKLNYSFYQEVYADCQSGAFTANLGRQGRLDNLGVGDVNEAINAIVAVGDPVGTPWYSKGAHGDGATRRSWWIYGWNNGPQACINAVV